MTAESWERILARVGEDGPLIRQLALQQAASSVLATASSFDEALPPLLRAICTTLGWRVGAAWLLDVQAGLLRCRATWPDDAALAEFTALCRDETLAHGVGLPGRAWETGEPTLFAPLPTDPSNFPRAHVAARAGLQAGIAFPVVVGGEPFGVLEFFNDALVPPDEDLRRTMGAIGALVAQFVARTRAVEALRDSEMRKAAMVESALDCIVCMDADGLITEFNRAAEETFGYRRADVLGRPLSEVIVPPELREAHRSGLRRYLATGEQHVLGQRIEITGMRSDGTLFPVELAIVRSDAAGGPQFTGFLRDLTDRARAEQERARLLGELRAAVQARDEFLSIASHELRTPVTSLQLQLQLLLRHRAKGVEAEEESERRLGAAVYQSERLAALIETLLDVSRLSAGRLELARSEVDLAEVVRVVCAQMAELARNAGCELRIVAPQPVTGSWDRARLEQVVTNLLSNAFKYAPQAPVDLAVSTNGEHAHVVVRDHGPGIADDVLSRVFERFERARGAAPGGLGLGLFLTRQIVEAHGGSVGVENHPDSGAVFRVVLPLGG